MTGIPTRPTPPPRAGVLRVVDTALEEDLGTAGDLTTDALVGARVPGIARFVARQAGTISGLSVAAEVFARLGGDVEVTPLVEDGDEVEAGTALAVLEGSTRTILTGERTALNLLGHLSGVATATRGVVRLVEDLGVRVADTRKTTPGLRALEKYAVRCGGGHNHRHGLHDAVMLKDNHLVAASSIDDAVRAVRSAIGHTVSVTVEVDHLEQIPEVLDAGADVILLDNLGADDLREAIAIIDGRALAEASGGITRATARELAEAGVDVISLGWLTHSAPRLDVALDLEPSATGPGDAGRSRWWVRSTGTVT